MKKICSLLLILSMLFTTCYAGAYDIVNLNGTTIVNDTRVLQSKTLVEGVKGNDCPIETPVCVVNNMTYSQYIDYINTYYGYTGSDAIVGTGIVGGTEKITGSSFAYAKDFAIDGNMGAEGPRRKITYIYPKFRFYTDLYRLYGSIALAQLGNGNGGWFTGGLFFGTDLNKSSVNTTDFRINAKTDKLPPVPWFTAKMKESGTVYVNSHSALPFLETKGYSLISTGTEAYYGVDTNNNNSKVTGPTYVYCKVFQKGDTVEIFNPANADISGHPPAWFFTTAIADTYTYEYGKKSSGVVATSFNKDLTDGVLYKNLFPDVSDSDYTSGGRWVSDFHPLGSGQRIASVEDPSLLGCDYFTFSINNRSKFGTVGGNILEFKVDKNCEVVILAVEKDSDANFEGFTKTTGVPSLTGVFPTANVVDAIYKMGVPYAEMSMDRINDFYSNSGLTLSEICDKWLSEYFPGATKEEILEIANKAALNTTLKKEIFASVDSVSSVSGNDSKYVYNVVYSKDFNKGDTVAIPDATGKSNFNRPIMVVVKPRYIGEAPALPNTFKTVDAKVGSNSHFKPVHQYASVQNPPDFTWPQINTAYSYDVIVCSDEALTDVVYSKEEIKYAYYNFTHPFEPGTYWWAVRYRTVDGGKPSDWSVARRFRIDPSAHEYIVPDFREVVDSVPKSHPRIWFTEDTVDEFVALKDSPNGQKAYNKMISQCDSYIRNHNYQEPLYGATDATSRSTTMGYMAQNAALCYYLTDDPEKKEIYGDFAVEVLMELTKWDMTNGGSAFNSNDQSFFEFYMRASMAYDWMYNYMTPEQRTAVQNMLVDRYNYLNNKVSSGKGHIGALRVEPFNSHLWSYIGYYGIGCLALVHDIESVDDYFVQMLELNSAHLPPMSIEDGGWSKGTGYWTYAFTRDKWFMDTMMYSGYIDYYDKAWARNEVNWALYMYPDNSYGSFGDEAGLNKPGTSHIMGLSKLGKYTDNPVAYWLRNKIGNIATQYGSGAFDAILYADTADEVGEAPIAYPNAHLFPDQGMVAMHSSVVNSNRTSLYFRSGQYGSYNHMHADQNAFMIEHNGNRLASKSGFYDSYHSTHDKGFTRQTFAHNSITYNGGFGQKDDSKDANGNIKQFVTHLDFDAAVGDAKNAYVGNIDKFDRTIIYLRPDSYIVVDDLENDTEQTYEWWLNARPGAMTVEGKKAHVELNGSHLNVEILAPAVEDGVFENNYINPSDGKEYYPDVESYKVTEETAEAGFDRVHFKTPSVLSTTIVATMNVNEGEENTFAKSTGENYIKLTQDGVTAYVCTSAGSEVTTDSGYKFTGTALVMNEASLMLVNGTSLSYKGSSVIDETSEPITFVVGKGQMSLGSNNDVVVTVHKNNAGIKDFLPEDMDEASIKDTNGRTIEKYNGKAHGSMGIMIDNKDNYFTLYADKGQYMLLTEDTSFVNPEQLMPTELELADLGNGVGRLTASVLWDGALIDAEINGIVHKNISLPYEFEYGDETEIVAKIRGTKYGEAWSEGAVMYPGHKLDISPVTFTDNGDGTVNASLSATNNTSSRVLRCKVIVAAYDENGSVVNVEHTQVTSIAKNEEKEFSIDVDAEGAETYKAFVWNNTGAIHMIDGATNAEEFVEDTGVDGGLMSIAPVATEFCNKTNGYLYANLHGRTEDDYSTVNGGRISSNYPSKSTQYHEVYYVDSSLEGYDYFTFQAGGYSMSEYDTILSFDIVEDSEVIILTSNSNMEFEGYDKEVNTNEGWLVSRYMSADFTRALRKLGITPTYAIANAFNADRTDLDVSGFEAKYITPAYEAATEKVRAEFDEMWAKVTQLDANGNIYSSMSNSKYTTKYSRAYTVEAGEEKATVTIPGEKTGNSSRCIVVIVKPYNNTGNPNDSRVCTPLISAASSNARTRLRAVQIGNEEVPVSEFVNKEYSCTINSNQMPLVKGITADNGLLVTTDYEVSEDGKSAVVTITVENLFTGFTPGVYKVNITLNS